MRIINASEAAREATEQLLASSKEYIVIGEGVPDPKACFGTTKGLKEKFPDQVFDSPVSENGVTGICIGAALNGLKPIHVHMRQDFLLYAMDQIVNNAAKWNSMFGGNGGSVPIVIKAFTGRGWGAGHQHAQNLESLFAHIPGLKVVTPSSAHNAKGLLIAAARDPNPVLILEHRWIHHLTSDVPEEMYETPIHEAEKVVSWPNPDVTIIAWGYQVSEAIRAARLLQGTINAEVIDLQSLRPLDIGTIARSMNKTNNVLITGEGWHFGGFGETVLAEIMRVSREHGLREPEVRRMTLALAYPSSSPALTRHYYPDYKRIAVEAAAMLGEQFDANEISFSSAIEPHDIPDKSFTGPF